MPSSPAAQVAANLSSTVRPTEKGAREAGLDAAAIRMAVNGLLRDAKAWRRQVSR